MDQLILKPGDDNDSILWVFWVEFLFTTIFMTIIFHTKYTKLTVTYDTAIKNLIVVLSLFGIMGCIGDKTGACLNPSIGLPAVIYNAIVAD